MSRDAVHALPSLERSGAPDGQFDDLDWLDAAVGDARVVAIGESSHFNGQSYRLRHRLLRYLVQRHGFSAYAMESGFVEGWWVNDWVHARVDAEAIGDVLANGMTSLMGMWVEMRDQLEWMRHHNRSGEQPINFYGIDPSGSNLSLLPGLDQVITYLADADPDYTVDRQLRQIAASFAGSSTFRAREAFAAYSDLAQDRKDALTAGLSALLTRLEALRPDYLPKTSLVPYRRALHALRLTIAEDISARDRTVNARDLAQADSVEWILQREDRIVLAAHNAHIWRSPLEFPGAIPQMTSAGQHLAERLGRAYLVIGTTTGDGQTLTIGEDFYAGQLFDDLPTPEDGTLDALMAASHDGPFGVDLRRLAPTDRDVLAAVAQQRLGAFSCPIEPLSAYDVLVHLPHVTAAHPDPVAVSSAPTETEAAFRHWLATR